jgi:structural maintenance of chromosome 1
MAARKEELKRNKKDLLSVQKSARECGEKRKKIDAELEEINSNLGQFRNSRRQNENEARLKEVVATLKGFYPGVMDRLTNLCRPTQKRYNMAVTQAGGAQMVNAVEHLVSYLFSTSSY